MRRAHAGVARDADLKAQRPRGRHIVGEHPANVTRLGPRCTSYHPDHRDHIRSGAVCRCAGIERLVI